jgi:hypothetical protein
MEYVIISFEYSTLSDDGCLKNRRHAAINYAIKHIFGCPDSLIPQFNIATRCQTKCVTLGRVTSSEYELDTRRIFKPAVQLNKYYSTITGVMIPFE